MQIKVVTIVSESGSINRVLWSTLNIRVSVDNTAFSHPMTYKNLCLVDVSHLRTNLLDCEFIYKNKFVGIGTNNIFKSSLQ